jgi:stage IV sporulation protein FB
MFGKSFTLGTIAGIRVKIHSTFLLIFGLILLSDLLGGAGPGAVAGELLFISLLFSIVVLHELGHALAARRFGIATRDITLYPIGGIARLDYLPQKPWQEISVAIAGPAVNFVLAGIMYVLSPLAAGTVGGMLMSRFIAINLGLGLFNLIPAFPMDGGRIFRALLTLKQGYLNATKTAASTGKVVAVLLGSTGLFLNPMLIFIAVFIWIAGSSELRMVEYRYQMEHAGDIWRVFTAGPTGRHVRVPHYTIVDDGWR